MAVESPADPDASLNEVAPPSGLTLRSRVALWQEHLPWRRSEAATRALGMTSTVVFVASLITGVIFRILHLLSYGGGVNADEGVVYLMARHAQHWQFQAFFWKEQYGGTLLEDVTGLVFHVTGPHIIVLQTVEAAFFLAAVLMMWTVLRREVDYRTANVAAALLWLAPLGVYFSVHDPGYSSAGLACAFATLLAASHYNGQAGRAALVGVLFGLTWWTTPLALLIAWPALVLLWPARRKPTHLMALAGGFLAGALPWLWRNVDTHFASRHPLPGQGTFVHRTREAVTVVTPAGLDPFGHLLRTHGTAVGIVAFGSLLAGVVVALALRRIVLAALLFSGLMWPVLIAKTGVALVPSSMRYVVFLLPALALVVGLVARRLSVVAVGALAYTTVVVLGSLLYPAHFDPRHSVRIAQVEAALNARHRTHIWATYWTAYVIDAQTQERITAAGLMNDRYARYRTLADSGPTTVLIPAGGPDDLILDTLTGGTRTRIGGLALWTWPEHIALPPLGNR